MAGGDGQRGMRLQQTPTEKRLSPKPRESVTISNYADPTERAAGFPLANWRECGAPSLPPSCHQFGDEPSQPHLGPSFACLLPHCSRDHSLCLVCAFDLYRMFFWCLQIPCVLGQQAFSPPSNNRFSCTPLMLVVQRRPSRFDPGTFCATGSPSASLICPAKNTAERAQNYSARPQSSSMTWLNTSTASCRTSLWDPPTSIECTSCSRSGSSRLCSCERTMPGFM
jgi:hypothetical protein